MFQIRIRTPAGHVLYSDETFSTRDEAHREIKWRSKQEGWEGCRWFIVNA